MEWNFPEDFERFLGKVERSYTAILEDKTLL
jgi:hypothetical protein